MCRRKTRREEARSAREKEVATLESLRAQVWQASPSFAYKESNKISNPLIIVYFSKAHRMISLLL